jgi:hypothetical protein
MKRRIISTVSALVLAVMLSPGAQATPENSVTYNIYYVCICGPPAYCSGLQGSWFLDCDDSFTGWGDLPDSNPGCEDTEVIVGRSCDNYCMPCGPG